MSFDDEYIDRNDEALVDSELKKNSQPAQHGVVVGSTISAFSFIGKLFLALLLMGISKATAIHFNQNYGALTTLSIMAVVGLIWFCFSKLSRRN